MPEEREEHARPPVYTFAEYTLDTGRGSLSKAGQELNLRPQSFRVLRYLVERPGLLVRRQELLDAVWAGAAVTDDSLTQCITEIRRVINDTSRTGVKTVPKRGFVFDIPVTKHIGAVSPAGLPEQRNRNVWIGAAMAAAAVVAVAIVWSTRETGEVPVPIAGDRTEVSIAVLPFDDMSEQQDMQYFGEGIAEEILNQLAQLDGLLVIARTSSFAFKGRGDEIAEIKDKLGVDYVLEGSVRRSAQQTRITAQLIETEKQTHIWSRTYDPDLTFRNLIEVQNEIAEQVAATVGVSTGSQSGDSAFSRPPANREALDYYLDGQFYLRQIEIGGAYDYDAAIDRFLAAIDADPKWAPAYAATGRVMHFRASQQGRLDRQEQYEESRRYLQRAIELNPSFGPAYESLAFITHFHDLDFVESEELYKKGLALGGRQHWGYALLMQSMGRHDDAIERFRTALAVDPLSRIIKAQYGWSLLCGGYFEESVILWDELTRLYGDRPVYGETLAYAHLRLGNLDEGRRLFEKYGRPMEIRGEYGGIYALLGMTKEAEEVLNLLESREGYALPHHSDAAMLLGQKERALAFIEAAAADDPRWLINVQCEIATGALWEEPRFRAVLRNAGFPEL